MLDAVALRTPAATALEFLGVRLSYQQLIGLVDRCADAFASLGLREGQRVLVVLPTCPQAVIAFLAANRLGATTAFVHPLSTAPELEAHLAATHARLIVALDAGARAAETARRGTKPATLILASLDDHLPRAGRLAYWWKQGRHIHRIRGMQGVTTWRQLLAHAHVPAGPGAADTNAPAAIFFSGGTTGTPKGIVLANHSLVWESRQVEAWLQLGAKDTVLAVMPVFHGFGLAGCILSVLAAGGRVILVPVFRPAEVARLLAHSHATLLPGVPALFDALAREPSLQTADLSSLRLAISGADSLPTAIRERFDALVASRGGSARLIEGYGLTEAVTGVLMMPPHAPRPQGLGVPFPDVLAKVCRPGTAEEVPVGEDGELCLAGPNLMQGYLDDPAATAEALRVHDDGRTWLHTGDLCHMDEDGYFHFTCRLKRLIKTAGVNVFPPQVEEVLAQHPDVAECCVVGVADPVVGERVLAFVVARARDRSTPELAASLDAHCRARLIKWSCPGEFRFCESLPRTRLGKVDYRALTAAAVPPA
jgi:long-chain acyl-CoA synthetase